MMFTLLSPYLGYIKGVAIVTLVALLVGGVIYFRHHEQQIGYDKAVAEYTKKELKAEQAARILENTLTVKLQEAQNASTERDIKIRELSHAVNVASSKLRDTIATVRRNLPKYSIGTSKLAADTGLNLFGECTERYTAVAEAADRHANDVKMLQDAWPK